MLLASAFNSGAEAKELVVAEFMVEINGLTVNGRCVGTVETEVFESVLDSGATVENLRFSTKNLSGNFFGFCHNISSLG